MCLKETDAYADTRTSGWTGGQRVGWAGREVGKTDRWTDGWTYLQQMITLSRTQTTHKLDERGRMCMSDATININTNFIDTVDKLEVKSF